MGTAVQATAQGPVSTDNSATPVHRTVRQRLWISASASAALLGLLPQVLHHVGRRVRHTVFFTGLVLALTAVAAPVLASASEEAQGAQLLQSVQAGKTSCQQLSRDQFELIGEYVMGRMLGPTAAHEAMNKQMTSVMGSAGEAQAHTFMGRRFAGCATGSAPDVFSTMMGMMGGNAFANGTMMGSGQSVNGSGTGMMGGSGVRGSGDNGWSGADTVMVVLMGFLLAAVVGTLAVWRPWQRSQVQTSVDLLGKRYANGEIDGEEYELRRQALAGLP